MTENLSIRACRLEDIQEVLELWRHADATPSVTDNADDLRRAITDSPAHVLVADAGGRLIGSIIGTFDGWRGNIYRLAVHPDFRRHGVAVGQLPHLPLIVVDGTFAICKLVADATIPPWASANQFFSITRTADELSIVCRQDAVPEEIRCERGWRCFRVAGAMPFSVVGVLASLTTPLAEAGISVFAISTFDTDYLLVKEDYFEKAVTALVQAGHSITK